MKAVIIPIHSFVDLITNSSSEVFVGADKATVKAVEEIVNKLLALGGSNLKSKDLFKIELASQYTNDEYDDVYLTDAMLKKAVKDGSIKFEADGLDEGEEFSLTNLPQPREGTENSYIIVTPLNDSKEVKAIADALGKLQGLFDGRDITSY